MLLIQVCSGNTKQFDSNRKYFTKMYEKKTILQLYKMVFMIMLYNLLIKAIDDRSIISHMGVSNTGI